MDAQTDTPGTGIGQIAVIQAAGRGPAVVAVAHEGHEVAATGNGGHALGTVLDVAVVTGSIPAEDAGGTPIHLVFHQGLDQPAFTLGVAHAGTGAVVAIGSVTAHGFHVTVVDVQLDVQRIPQGQGDGQTGPEHGTVSLAGSGISHAVGGRNGTGVGPHGQGSLAVGTGHAVHGPGGHLHAVEGQGHHQGEQVHVVLVIRTIRASSVVIVVRTGPESGQAHVLVELVAGHHAGHVVIKDGGTTGHVGQLDALDTHAELEVGIGHHPVDVGVLQFHHGAVSAQSAAAFGIAPHLVTNFEEHGTGQGFGSHGVQLQADTLGSGEDVVGVSGAVVVAPLSLRMADQGTVTGGEAHQPLAFGLEINSAGAGSGTQQHTRSKSEGHQLFHDKNLPS